MYYDDAHLTDLESNGKSSQWSFGMLNAVLGTPFADEKQQPLSDKGTFLGLDCDFTEVGSDDHVQFWVRERLESKGAGMIRDAKSSGVVTPSQASKLYDTLNFLESGVFGRVGCGGLQPLKDHQYGRSSVLSARLATCFEVIEAILQLRPRCQFMVRRRQVKRVLAASDAALEVPRQGSGGYLILWHPAMSRPSEAFVAYLPEDLYVYWVGDHKIAQLEMLMIAHALLARPQEFRGRRGVWFIENVASLMCLIRGRSDSAKLEETCHFIHVVLFALRASLYWEYIPSKSNWADPVSRLGSKDPWHWREGFT